MKEHSDRRTILAQGLVFLKGMAMGAADAVPGVSGGTIAVMAHIYERLVSAIRAVVPACRMLVRGSGPASAWRVVDGNFLLTLIAGILVSLLLVANVVLYLLETRYPLVMAFFSGLVLASVRFLLREVDRWSMQAVLFCLLASAITVAVSLASPVTAPDPSAWYLFFCGAIAISAMILPGLSGAFILLLMGVYAPVLQALRTFQWSTILVFAAGCLCGLLTFAHLLAWVFRRYRRQTYAAIIGMLGGSLVALWPWKDTMDGGVGVALLGPGEYRFVTGQAAQPLTVLGLVVAGFLLVVVLERMAGRLVR